MMSSSRKHALRQQRAHEAKLRRKARAKERRGIMKIGGLKGKTVSLREAHEAAVLKDRRLWVDEQATGKWFTDHILDYVRENGDALCVVEDDTDTTVRVRLVSEEEERDQAVGQFLEVMSALTNLGYTSGREAVTIKPVVEGDRDRVTVKLDNEQVGIYDFIRHTFVD